MKALLLILVFLQQEEIIQKAYKSVYMKASSDCEKAMGLLENDPAEAINLLTRILENGKVKKRECLLRIEILPGTYSKKHSFFPYQYRGRAYLKLSENTADSDKATRLLQNAKRDLEESIRRGLPSSKSFLKTVREKLQIKKPPTNDIDPEPAFRKAWLRLITQNRFVAAKRHLEKEGKVLSTEKRTGYLKETEEECRIFLRLKTRQFLMNLEQNSDPTSIGKMSVPIFSRTFELPESSELVVTTPESVWARSFRITLGNLHRGKKVHKELYDHAITAIPLSTDRWFHATENIIYLLIRSLVDNLRKRAWIVEMKTRLQLEETARTLVEGWNRFQKDVRIAAKDRDDFLALIPRRKMATLMDQFPVEYEGFPQILSDLQKATESDSPEDDLRKISTQLYALKSGKTRYTMESRAEMVRIRIITIAFRSLLADEPMDDIISKLRPMGTTLKQLNGSFDMKHLGPRIQKIFDGLR